MGVSDKLDDLVFLRFLKSHTCYDVLPTSNKVVVLDTQLNVSRSHLPRAIPTLHALTTINYCYLMLKLV